MCIPSTYICGNSVVMYVGGHTFNRVTPVHVVLV